jgi:hypothetical protein
LLDKGLAHGTILEGCDDLVVGRAGYLGTVLGEAVYVVTETLTLLLLAMAKFAGVARPGVGALEVPYEGVSELSLVVDLHLGEALEPGKCQVGKVQQDALDDEHIACRPAVVAGEAVVLKPKARVGLSIILCDGGRSTISS